jgi:hypothetical protein
MYPDGGTLGCSSLAEENCPACRNESTLYRTLRKNNARASASLPGGDEAASKNTAATFDRRPVDLVDVSLQFIIISRNVSAVYGQ